MACLGGAISQQQVHFANEDAGRETACCGGSTREIEQATGVWVGSVKGARTSRLRRCSWQKEQRLREEQRALTPPPQTWRAHPRELVIVKPMLHLGTAVASTRHPHRVPGKEATTGCT